MGKFAFRDPSAKPLDHWDGYITWLLGRRHPFRLIPLEKLRAMTPDEHQKYDLSRLNFISDNLVVENETVENLSNALAAVMRMNSGRKRGGLGVFLSAPSGLGKTVALHAVLCEVLADALDADPDCISENRSIPVGYVCIPDSGTPKSIYMEIADYLGIEYRPRDHDPQMRKMVLTGIEHAGIQVFVIDEVHNLDNGGPYAKRAVDAVRRLADDSQATFIIAGINLEQTSLTRGERGRQIAGRYIRAEVTRYDRGSPDWRSRWKGLVEALVRALPLYATDRSEMVRMAGWMHEQSNGSVQQLNSILTQAADRLIRQGYPAQESITKALLGEARLNLATETHQKAQFERTARESQERGKPGVS